MKKVAVLLSGAGVFDGAEIHESVLTLWALDKRGFTYQVFAPDVWQHHVINHLNGEEMPEKRNVLVESARISRGNSKNLAEYQASDFDGLVLPGGFGVAKNLTKWAFQGPDGDILPEVRRAIRETVDAGKPILGLCMGPAAIAKALEGSVVKPLLTVGSTEAASPYDIAGVSAGLEKTGARPVQRTVREIAVDEAHKIVTAPCYMMEARISEVASNIDQAVEAFARLMNA
ncbi:MAG: isoprenoid biosynthesis glyoxalase ElbB [Flavobacteriales bacterium]|nr:isoprenoid biosynthesis glyoxalase ElbB [Flavobacteriales bacterium]MCX7650435.1 isoprenoid biosynthesis glyoxalase ElbB [Flavobacteriales bacterium]MDW8433110.1 isoprenoid biosynthesis glyoxalase ElbB [Flavobacteriales bacterium]